MVACSYPNSRRPFQGIFVRQQVEALSERYSVRVLSPTVHGLRSAINGVRRQGGAPGEVEGVVERPSTFSPLPLCPNLVDERLLSGAKKGLARLVERWGVPDLIAGHFAVHSGWLAWKLSLLLGVPFVLHEHASPFSMYLEVRHSAQLAREAIRNAARVIAVSPHLEREILVFEPGARTTVVGNLVDTEFFTPGDSVAERKAFRFLFVGNLVEQKGAIYLLRAARLLAEESGAQFEIVIAGDGPLRAFLQEEAIQLGISSTCIFVGGLPHDQIRDQMRACDALVMPSLYESFCIVLAEAMACGKPVISTRCGGPEYVVESGAGLLVEAGNPAALSGAMRKLLEGKPAFVPERIRESVVRRFSKSVFLERIGGIYEQVRSDVKWEQKSQTNGSRG